jgi:hypothetical protein
MDSEPAVGTRTNGGSPGLRNCEGLCCARCTEPVAMPTIHREGPYRFHFDSDEGTEPPHVHVERDDSEAKFWLDPVRLVPGRGFSRQVLNHITAIVERNRQRFLERWNEHFHR